MARLTKRHRLAIARGVRRYWKRVKTTSRERNVGIVEARRLLKVQRQEEIRAKRKRGPGRIVGWQSPDPEGEVGFNLKDRDEMEPPPWTPSLVERFRNAVSVTVSGYWEYRASPQSAALADDFERTFDPGSTAEEFWSAYFEAIREVMDEVTNDEKYERFGIYVTRMK